ncbi:glutathione-disulfide reductase [Luteimonas sp. RD2P54]|uniref:Glutathione-disulfide reductase n=1 Tax=Luteimonas endophytica TaxID=3042023 RepID=A0ABT6JC57_9GAMM|nr:glutathione-disulfide reductase [Luteimonas endophytica]MDH5824411.1 glutathione-disulfide reductase [Luteimonas endophytica]
MSATDPLEFDLVVLGGGSGGLAGAFRAAAHGARVALLEPAELGGTCVNAGCVPKKAMWLAAQLASQIGAAAELGFDVPAVPGFDWPEFITDRQRYIDGIHESYRRRLDQAGVVLMPRRGALQGPRTVVADDGTRLHARHVLIATGSHPLRPRIPGAELGGVSDDFFALRRAPARVALVGGGYISVELAGVLQALGSRVELFVRGPRLLSHADEDVVAQLEENYRQLGVGLHFGYRLREVEPGEDGRVRLLDADGAATEAFDTLLYAIGRRANSAGIGLDRAGVATDARGNIAVDAFQNTTAEGVYAVGDVVGRETLTPVAIAAARRLMDRLFGGREDARLDYELVPTVVFAHPPIGGVGLTEAQARERHGDAVRVYRSRFRPMLQALVDTPLCSLFKLVCVGEERRVVGIHLFGEAADEILQGFAVALKLGATLADLHDTVAIHPTSAEELVLMS